MHYHILEARHVRDFVVWLRFRDGTSGEIDLGPELRGPVFEPLRDSDTFRAFRIDPEFHTLVWPNGADFAPEFLHDSIKVTAQHAAAPGGGREASGRFEDSLGRRG